MSSPQVTVSCPLCAASLALNDENAGSRLTCPGCAAELALPAFVDESLRPAVVKAPEKDGPRPETSPPPPRDPAPGPVLEAGKKAALPPERNRAAAEERRRQALDQRAVAAMGLPPPGAEPPVLNPPPGDLPADRPKTVLPVRRRVEDQTLSENIPSGGGTPSARPPHPSRGPRGPLPPADAPGDSSWDIAPIPVRGDAQFSPTALPQRRPGAGPGGKSKAPSAPPSAPEPSPFESAAPEPPRPKPPRGGHRLGSENRKPVFAPLHEPAPADVEKEGGWAVEPSGVNVARTRRLVALALLMILLAGVGVAVWMMKYAFEAPPPSVERKAPAEDPLKNVAEARPVLQRFFAAATIEDLAQEARHPEESLPRMRRHYAANPLQPRKIIREHDSWEEVSAGGREFITGLVELDDFRAVDVALEVFPSGPPKVDWEFCVNWAEIPWRDFVKKPTEETVEFRVIASPADYYNHSFRDKTKDFFCFRVEDPEKFASAWAYCEKNSEVATKLHFHLRHARQRGILNRDRQPYVHCVLRLRFPPEGLKTNQMMIEEFVRDGWIVP